MAGTSIFPQIKASEQSAVGKSEAQEKVMVSCRRATPFVFLRAIRQGSAACHPGLWVCRENGLEGRGHGVWQGREQARGELSSDEDSDPPIDPCP